MFAVCLTTILFIGPLGGLLAGQKQKPDAVASQTSIQETAQELGPPAPSEDAPVVSDPGILGSGTRALGATILVLALIWMTTVLLKRYMPHRFGPLGHKRRIQVLETVPIGDKRSLTLVRIDGEGLLLASTPGSVSLLKEIKLEQASEQTPQSANPKERLKTSQSGTDLQTSQKFSDTLADELRHANSSKPEPLAAFSRLRRELEAQTS